jgi:CheY-like chemotaxis protein
MPSILIVDDEPEGTEPIVKFLQREGFQVTAAPNGREALAYLSTVMPELLILDLRMPQMDGISFLATLRSYMRWKDLPVILMTAYAEGPHLDIAKRYGAVDVFKKGSVDLKQLLAVIREKLPHHDGATHAAGGMIAPEF